MSKAQTLTDIVNLSLSSLGQNQITNIDADGKTENQLRPLLFEAIRQTQLEIMWQELVVSFSPSKSPDQYAPNEAYSVYNLPTNFLDVLSLKSGAYWFLEGGKLITTDQDPFLTYKKYSEEPSEWTGYLVEMVYKRLAFNASMAVTQNAQIQQQSAQLYELSKSDNLMRSANRQRDYATSPSTFGWMTSRSRRYGRGRR